MGIRVSTGESVVMHTANIGLPSGRRDELDVIFTSFGKIRHWHARPSKRCVLHFLRNLLRTLDRLMYDISESLWTCNCGVDLMETTLSSVTVLDPDIVPLPLFIYIIYSTIPIKYGNTHSCWADALKCEVAGEKRFYTLKKTIICTKETDRQRDGW